MSPVTVLELQRAWRAIQTGQFSDAVRHRSEVGGWTPAEPVLPVLGAHGQCGASTVALALATVLAPARVVECASGPSCGLVGAPTTEIGDCGNGWTRGLRADVLVDRCREILLGATEVPLPAEVSHPVSRTVLDVAWDPTQVLSVSSWLSSWLLGSPCVVVVATVSVPSLRRLENTLSVLTEPVCLAAVVGPPLKRWPKTVTGTLGAQTRHLIETQRLVSVPTIASLRLAGITPEPLPKPLLAAAEDILLAAEELSSIPTQTKKDT